MSRQPWLIDALADEFRGAKGFRVDVYPGAESRGRTNFAPKHVMDHHTGPGAYNALLRYMAEGPVHPPLCNYATSRPYNGVVRVTVVATGRANHAGRGKYETIATNQGNKYSFGAEHQNDGRQSWPDQQVEAMRRCDAALLKHMNRGTAYMLDHKTYAGYRGKYDRHTLSLDSERRAVNKMLTDPWEGWWMSLTDKEKKVLESFSSYLAEKEVEGHSFARQTLSFLREDSANVRTLLDTLKRVGSSPLGFAKHGVAAIRFLRKDNAEELDAIVDESYNDGSET